MGFPYRQIIFLFGSRPQEAVNRAQQLARYFADVVPVLYVPYGSLRHWLDGEWRCPPWSPLSRHPNVHFLSTPASICLGRRSASAGFLNGLHMAWRLKRQLAAERLRQEEVLGFVYSPVAAPVLRWFPDLTIHYDCADDHEHWWKASPRMARLNRAYEDYVGQRARTITATSQVLLSKMKQYHHPAALVPNGVDWEHFRVAGGGVPTELEGLPRPILGFIGMTADYLDWDLVEGLLKARIGSLVFIGPSPRFQKRFEGYNHIHFLGPRPYQELPRYVHAFDVCLIPANRQAAALAASPGKLYQYLAAGKPVVTTDLPEFQPYREVIQVAHHADDFIKLVGEAWRSSADESAQRSEVARNSSWRQRAGMILDFISTTHVPGVRHE